MCERPHWPMTRTWQRQRHNNYNKWANTSENITSHSVELCHVKSFVWSATAAALINKTQGRRRWTTTEDITSETWVADGVEGRYGPSVSIGTVGTGLDTGSRTSESLSGVASHYIMYNISQDDGHAAFCLCSLKTTPVYSHCLVFIIPPSYLLHLHQRLCVTYADSIFDGKWRKHNISSYLFMFGF